MKKHQNSCEVYEKAPLDFHTQVHVAACYLHVNHQFLLLQCSSQKKQEAEAWGAPAGKIEKNETPLEAAEGIHLMAGTQEALKFILCTSTE